MHDMQNMREGPTSGRTTDLLTATHVGARLGVDTSTVYRMAADGRLPAVKVGRQWRFPRSQLERALAVGIPVPAPAGTGTDAAAAAGSPAADSGITVVPVPAE